MYSKDKVIPMQNIMADRGWETELHSLLIFALDGIGGHLHAQANSANIKQPKT